MLPFVLASIGTVKLNVIFRGPKGHWLPVMMALAPSKGVKPAKLVLFPNWIGRGRDVSYLTPPRTAPHLQNYCIRLLPKVLT
jgi:hypothetical protein